MNNKFQSFFCLFAFFVIRLLVIAKLWCLRQTNRPKWNWNVLIKHNQSWWLCNRIFSFSGSWKRTFGVLMIIRVFTNRNSRQFDFQFFLCSIFRPFFSLFLHKILILVWLLLAGAFVCLAREERIIFRRECRRNVQPWSGS